MSEAGENTATTRGGANTVIYYHPEGDSMDGRRLMGGVKAINPRNTSQICNEC